MKTCTTCALFKDYMIRLPNDELEMTCYNIIGECKSYEKWRPKQPEETMSEYCINCRKYKTCTSEYRGDSGYCDAFKFKNIEETMSDKIQMTEEQVRDMLKKVYCISDDAESVIESMLNNMERSGYIIKSEIEQKIEEASDDYTFFKNNNESINRDVFIDELWEIIQLLKPYYYNSKEEKK